MCLSVYASQRDWPDELTADNLTEYDAIRGLLPELPYCHPGRREENGWPDGRKTRRKPPLEDD